jgi:ABC-type multidrug transport system fused ATPase/permease subunit
MPWAKLTFAQRTKVRNLLEQWIAQDIPGFEVLEKKQSLWMKILSKVLFFTPNFMDRFVTTFYPKVYIPSRDRWETNNYYSTTILLHEYVHLSDRQRLGLLFNFLYLSPQILAVFALLYPVSPWFLLFLLAALPIPSLGRTWAEIRGYRMSIATHYWLTGDKYNIDFVVNQFVSSNYYWMFPFKGWIKDFFEREYEKIKREELSPELTKMKNLLTSYTHSVYNNLI